MMFKAVLRNLPRLNLPEAEFTKAELSEAKFNQAELPKAEFNQAEFARGNLPKLNLPKPNSSELLWVECAVRDACAAEYIIRLILHRKLPVWYGRF